MCEEDGRTNPIEKRHACVAIQFLLAGKTRQRRIVLRVELVEYRIAGDAGSRPLGVTSRLRPQLRALRGCESFLNPSYRAP